MQNQPSCKITLPGNISKNNSKGGTEGSVNYSNLERHIKKSNN